MTTVRTGGRSLPALSSFPAALLRIVLFDVLTQVSSFKDGRNSGSDFLETLWTDSHMRLHRTYGAATTDSKLLSGASGEFIYLPTLDGSRLYTMSVSLRCGERVHRLRPSGQFA